MSPRLGAAFALLPEYLGWHHARINGEAYTVYVMPAEASASTTWVRAPLSDTEAVKTSAFPATPARKRSLAWARASSRS